MAIIEIVLISIGLAMDASTVSLSVLDVNILYSSLMIGVITVAMTYGIFKIGTGLGGHYLVNIY